MNANQQQSNKFNFFIPLEIEKGVDGKLVKISGVCSTDAEDSDGETLIPAGFDFAPLLQSGFLNWNHQARTTSKAICGEPTSAKVINGGKDFYIEGVLYPNAEGKNVVELAETLQKHSPNRRLGFSIEGQAIERDILNPKRVTRAKITGVAITQSPKNPNTLMNIVKGEYDSEFVDIGDIELKQQEQQALVEPQIKLTITCDRSTVSEVTNILTQFDPQIKILFEAVDQQIDKAMMVDVNINPPSIEGAGSKNQLVNLLKKSDIYNQIQKRYTEDFEKAEQIYEFINQVKNKYMVTDNITPDVLQKAFNLLDESILLKAEDQKSEGDYDKKDEMFNEEDDDNKDVEKADMKNDDNEDDDEDFEKAINAEDFAKSLFDKGMDHDEVVKAMTSVGVNLVLAQTACSNCLAQANENKQGGNITPLSKGGEDESQENLINKLAQNIENKFSALGTILKSTYEQNALLASKVDVLEKSNEDLLGKVKRYAATPEPRRSATTAKAVERFEKSADGSTIHNFDSSSANDMRNLSTRLFQEVELLKSNGQEDRGLEKAVADLEIAKSTDFRAIAPRLRAMNINVY